MGSYRKTFKTVQLEDGMFAVVRTNAGEPHILEVVAMFYDLECAREYADIKNGQHIDLPKTEPVSPEHSASGAEPEENSRATNEAAPELTERQSAVLEALRANTNGENIVEMSVAALAEASNVPLGTTHSVLQSLEKKQCILAMRSGSGRARAAYQVL